MRVSDYLKDQFVRCVEKLSDAVNQEREVSFLRELSELCADIVRELDSIVYLEKRIRELLGADEEEEDMEE